MGERRASLGRRTQKMRRVFQNPLLIEEITQQHRTERRPRDKAERLMQTIRELRVSQ